MTALNLEWFTGLMESNKLVLRAELEKYPENDAITSVWISVSTASSVEDGQGWGRISYFSTTGVDPQAEVEMFPTRMSQQQIWERTSRGVGKVQRLVAS